MFKGFKIIQEGKESYYSSLDEFPESYKKILKQAEENIAQLLTNKDGKDKVLVIETNSKGTNYKNVKIDNLYKEEVKDLLGEDKTKISKENILEKSNFFDDLEIDDVKKNGDGEFVNGNIKKVQNFVAKAESKKDKFKESVSFDKEKKGPKYLYLYILLFLLLVVIIIIFK